MDQSCASEVGLSTKIDGRFLPTSEENFRSGVVGDVCYAIWGEKADAKTAAIVGKTDRAMRDQFSGRARISAELLTAINVALTRRG